MMLVTITLIGVALALFGISAAYRDFRGYRPRKARLQIPEVYTDPQPPQPSELIQAHLVIRDVGYFWRRDLSMWCAYKNPVKGHAVHPDDGYIVFVTINASLCGWLNGCDALQFHSLRRDADGAILSLQNIDPVTGQPIT